MPRVKPHDPYESFTSHRALTSRALEALGRNAPSTTIGDEATDRVLRRSGLLEFDARPLPTHAHVTSAIRRGAAWLAATACGREEPVCGECPLLRFCARGRNTAWFKESDAQLESSPSTSLTFVDLFCGAGGLSLGLETAGFTPVLAIDHDASAIATYRYNRPWLDSANVSLQDLSAALPEIPYADLLAGGPPCQGFSNANRQRLSDDPRNSLYKVFLEAASTMRPRVVLMENVFGMVRAASGVAKEFEEIGFNVRPYVLDAVDFGVPQRRRRVFWIGVRSDLLDLGSDQRLNHCMSSPATNPVPLLRNLEGLPALSACSVSNATSLESKDWGYMVDWRPITADPRGYWILNHRSKFLNSRDAAIYARLQPGEDSSADWFHEVNPYPNRQHIFKDKFSRLDTVEPSKTITAHMYYDCHMYIHPTQDRGLTPREAARLQGFPDDYTFLGYPNEWYRQVGNAVNPIVAAHVGRALRAILSAEVGYPK